MNDCWCQWDRRRWVCADDFLDLANFDAKQKVIDAERAIGFELLTGVMWHVFVIRFRQETYSTGELNVPVYENGLFKLARDDRREHRIATVVIDQSYVAKSGHLRIRG